MLVHPVLQDVEHPELNRLGVLCPKPLEVLEKGFFKSSILTSAYTVKDNFETCPVGHSWERCMLCVSSVDTSKIISSPANYYIYTADRKL